MSVTSLPEEAQKEKANSQAAGRMPGRAFLRSGWFAAIFFLLATIAFTWPLATHITDTLPDEVDGADGARQIGDIARNLRTDPLHLYNSQGLYPLDNDLVLNEMLVAQGVMAAPVVWLAGNPVPAWNLLAAASFFLSGLAAWLLVRHATGSSLAGVAAGVIFAFSPWHYGQYSHVGLLAQQWMVFALFFLALLMERSALTPRLLDRRTLLLLGGWALFTVVQALATGYYAYYEAILFGLYLLYYMYYSFHKGGIASLIGSKLRRKDSHGTEATIAQLVNWHRLAGQLLLLMLGGALALAVIFPFIRPYTEVKNTYGFSRSLNEVEYWSAGAKSLLRTTATSWLYGPVEQHIFGLQTSSEREMYPGVAATALALLGLLGKGAGTWGTRGISRKWNMGPGLFAVIALVGLILSFGPTLHGDTYGLESTGFNLPYRWLYEHVPGFDALRVPQRFDLLVMLGLGACAGFGILRLQNWSKGRAWARLVPTGAVALVMLEFFAPGLRWVPMPQGQSAPPLYKWLASPDADRTIPKDALLLELPVSLENTALTSSPQYLLYGLQHGRPMLNGTPNIVPPGYERLFSEMRRFPTPGTLDIIEGLGVKFLIVHTAGLLNEDKRAALASAALNGRLEAIQTFPEANSDGPDGAPDPASRAVVYRVEPDPQRLSKLKAAIPPGSSVFLADHPAHLRLYNTALPLLLGPDRRYFTNYHTIYDVLIPGLQPWEPGPRYDFAVLYKDDDPAKYGYSRTGIVDVGNDTIQVYRKP